jgi:hypothetical protein
MANVQHAGKLREGAQAWNLWRARNPGVVPDLSDFSLPDGARRFGPEAGGPIDLRHANLRRTVLAGGDLAKARLNDADLTGADLSGANLGRADLTGARLAGANLSGAWLADARGLTQAQIDHAHGHATTMLPDHLAAPPGWLGEERAEPPPPEEADHGDDGEADKGPDQGAGWSSSQPAADDGSEGDPYSILGVATDASQSEIRAAYLRLAKELHPDGRPAGADADHAAERLKLINDAYQKLKETGRQVSVRKADRRHRARAAFMAGVLSAMAPVVVVGLFAVWWLDVPSSTAPQTVAERTEDAGAGAPDSAGETAAVPPGAVEPQTNSVQAKENEVSRGKALAAARSHGTREAWQRLMAAFPDDDEAVAEAKGAIAAIERAEAHRQEAIDWARIEKSGDVQELQRFVLAHPDSARVGRAREMIAAIELAEARRRQEASAWAEAERGGGRAELRRFVAAFPDSFYVGRAQEMIAAIELAETRRREAVAWSDAQRSGEKAGLERFARVRPHSVYAPEARRRVALLEAEERRKDDVAWERAVRGHSPAAYDGYLTAHPNGRRAADARLRKSELERAEARPVVESAQTTAGSVTGTVAAAPAGRPRGPEVSQGWSSSDEPFLGADERIRR